MGIHGCQDAKARILGAMNDPATAVLPVVIGLIIVGIEISAVTRYKARVTL